MSQFLLPEKPELTMNCQLFGLTQDQLAEIMIVCHFANETLHKQTARIL